MIVWPMTDMSTHPLQEIQSPPARQDPRYFKLFDGKVDRTVELGKTPTGGLVFGDVDADGCLVGIEVVG